VALSRGEYALYLSRGEGMAAYVYDFGVQEAVSVAAREGASSRSPNISEVRPAVDASAQPRVDAPTPQVFKDASIGIFSDGNPDVRHDGVTVTAVTPGGPADQAGINAGDVILAINDHYLFTIGELKQEIGHHEPGMKVSVRYRRYSTIYDASLVVGRVQ
jgi:S1-C subfamily serine protease